MATFLGFPRDGHAFTSIEVGTVLGGLVRRDVNGLPVQGIIGVPPITAVPAAWQVRVAPFVYVKTDGASVQFSGVSAAENIDIENAANLPTGQARIDLICWDADAGELVVVAGAPAASPVAPSSGGLEPLATVRVNAGDASVVAARVVRVYTSTSMQGPESRVVLSGVSKRTIQPAAAISLQQTFPDGYFTGVPQVQATLIGEARDCNVTVDNVTKDGFTLILGSAASRPRSIGASWRASQL